MALMDIIKARHSIRKSKAAAFAIRKRWLEK